MRYQDKTVVDQQGRSHILCRNGEKESRIPFRPRLILVEEGIDSHEMVVAVRRAFPHCPLSTLHPESSEWKGRGALMLRRRRGRFVRPCPGTRRYLCCGYFVLNLALGCPYECVYCIIPHYYGTSGVTLFVNVEDALRELREFVLNRDDVTRIGTGEWSDSLALDPCIPLSRRLVENFRELPNAVLELKTKSTHVDPLLGLAHGGHTVVAWSLNAPSVIARAEPGTPSLVERLLAARRCQQHGYPIALHWDPIILTEQWEEEYSEAVRTVFEILDPRSILWISLGALRYPPSLSDALRESGLGLGEFFPGLDGKLRYLRPLRVVLFRSMADWIRGKAGFDPLIYLCMESPDVWKASLGWVPAGLKDLDRRFQERIRLFWSRPH